MFSIKLTAPPAGCRTQTSLHFKLRLLQATAGKSRAGRFRPKIRSWYFYGTKQIIWYKGNSDTGGFLCAVPAGSSCSTPWSPQRPPPQPEHHTAHPGVHSLKLPAVEEETGKHTAGFDSVIEYFNIFLPREKKSSTNNLRVNFSLPVWWAGRETASCIWLKVETSGTGDEGTSVKTCDCSLHWQLSCFMIAARWRNTHLFQHLRNELWWPAALKVFFYKL